MYDDFDYDDRDYERWQEQEAMELAQVAHRLRAYSAMIYQAMYGQVVLPAAPPTGEKKEWIESDDGLSLPRLSDQVWYELGE